MASVLKVDTIKSLAGNEAITISESGVTTFANPLIQTTPIFQANFALATVSNGVLTKLVNETVQVDNYSWWNAANNRWIPEIPGWYEITYDGFATSSSGSTVSLAVVYIYVNGSNVTGSQARPNALSTSAYASTFYQFNGTSDFLEAYAAVYGNGTLRASGRLMAKLLQRDPL